MTLTSIELLLAVTLLFFLGFFTSIYIITSIIKIAISIIIWFVMGIAEATISENTVNCDVPEQKI